MRQCLFTILALAAVASCSVCSNHALLFRGTEWLTVRDAPDLDSLAAMTVEAWIAVDTSTLGKSVTSHANLDSGEQGPHVAFTYDGASRTAVEYVDGAAATTNTDAYPIPATVDAVCVEQ